MGRKKAACIADDLYGLGYNIVGFVSDGTEKKGGVAGDRVIGRLESLPVIVEEKKVDELVVALETVDNNRLMDILYSVILLLNGRSRYWRINPVHYRK